MRLKLPVIIIAAASMSCCAHERVETPGGTASEIGFSTAFPAETRGEAVTTPAGIADNGGFYVWAYTYTGTWDSAAKEELLATAVTSADNGVSWEYASATNWPEPTDVKTAFFAYSPAGSATAKTPSGNTPEITYTVDSSAEEQQDLLIADDLLDQYGYNYYPTGGKVNMQFRHALSQISFSAMYIGTDATNVKVSKIELGNVYCKGDAKLATPVEWTLAADVDTYVLEAGDNVLDDNVMLDGTSQDIMVSGQRLYLMPQTVGRATSVIQLAVTFDVDGGELTHTTPLVTPVEWLPGKSYMYQIILEDDAIQVIVIDNDLDLAIPAGAIALQTVSLSYSYDPVGTNTHDVDNLYSAIKTLNTIAATTPVVGGYNYYGIYGLYDVTQDITLNVENILDGTANNAQWNIQTGQHLMFDVKKSIRSWGKDSDNEPYTFKIEYDPGKWELSAAKQPFSIDTSIWNMPENYTTYVDGVTSATLPATVTKITPIQDDPAPELTILPASEISSIGSIILIKK